MMSQEQLKVDYWSVIVKLSYSVANYVITAQQSAWSQITGFVSSSLTQLLIFKTRSATSRAVDVVQGVQIRAQGPSGPTSRPNWDHTSSTNFQNYDITNEMKAVLDCRWWEHLSNWILKFAPCHVDLSKQPSSLLPTKAVFPFSHYKIFVASYFTTLPPFFSLQWFRGGTKWNSQVRAVHAFENHSPVFYAKNKCNHKTFIAKRSLNFLL